MVRWASVKCQLRTVRLASNTHALTRHHQKLIELPNVRGEDMINPLNPDG